MTCSEIASVGGTSAAPAEPDWRCSTSSSTRNGSPSACASSTSRVAESVAPRAAASLRTSAWDRRSSSTVVTPGRRASPAAGTDNGPSSRTVATTRTGRVTAATATWASTAHESASAHCRSSRTSRQGRRWPTSPRNRATASPSTSPGSTPVSGGAPPAASVQSGSSRPSAAPYGPRAAGVISCPARRAATSASAIGRKAPPPSIARPVARRGSPAPPRPAPPGAWTCRCRSRRGRPPRHRGRPQRRRGRSGARRAPHRDRRGVHEPCRHSA